MPTGRWMKGVEKLTGVAAPVRRASIDAVLGCATNELGTGNWELETGNDSGARGVLDSSQFPVPSSQLALAAGEAAGGFTAVHGVDVAGGVGRTACGNC